MVKLISCLHIGSKQLKKSVFFFFCQKYQSISSRIFENIPRNVPEYPHRNLLAIAIGIWSLWTMDNVGLCRAMNGYVWLCMAMYGYVWSFSLMLYDDSIGFSFLDILWASHFVSLKVRPESFDQASSRFRSDWRDTASPADLTSL